MGNRVLVIDDIREIPEADYTAKTYDDGIQQLMENGPWDLLMLDHDLDCIDEKGEEKTGYSVMCWLEENPQYLPKRIVIITSDPVGRENMQRVIDKIKAKRDLDT